MLSEAMIEVENSSKTYRVYARPVDRLLQSLFRQRQYYREVRALQDISISVKKGETVGILGPNGSGKSTLLQMIAGTLSPTTGTIRVRGRVAALLELGAGFNPEFTGRENVYLSASILGLSEKEIQDRYQDIVDFADIGEGFLEQQVKTYSSGMYVRLAFSVAINVDPDILIVDEALSVGDVRFQRKCYRRFESIKRKGATVLFVTHSMELIQNHCNRAIYLNSGKIRAVGSPRDVIHRFMNDMFSLTAENEKTASKKLPVAYQQNELNFQPGVDCCRLRKNFNPSEYRYGDGRAEILDFLVSQGSERNLAIVQQHQRILVEYAVLFTADVERVIYGLTVKATDGTTLYGINSRDQGLMPGPYSEGDTERVSFTLDASLLPNTYFLSMGVAEDHDKLDSAALDRRYDVAQIVIQGDQCTAFGLVDLRGEMALSHISQQQDLGG